MVSRTRVLAIATFSAIHFANAIEWKACDDIVKEKLGLSTAFSPQSFQAAWLTSQIDEDQIETLNEHLPREFGKYPYPPGFESNSIKANRHLRGLMDSGELELQCGIEKLPVDPRTSKNPADGTIEYAVYRLRKKNIPAGEDIHYWVFQGGLADPGLIRLSAMNDAIKNNWGTSIYIADHRGTGRSSLLRCNDQMFDKFSRYRLEDKEVVPCNTALASNGQNLKHYHVTNAAWDAIALIEAEKVASSPKQVRLHGNSYGTMWVQRMMQLKSDVADRVVLEGLMSNSTVLNKAGFGPEEAGKRLMAYCAQDEECSKAYPKGLESLKEYISADNFCTGLVRDSRARFMHSALSYALANERIVDSSGKVTVDYRALVLSMIHRFGTCEDNSDDIHVGLYTLNYIFNIDFVYLYERPDDYNSDAWKQRQLEGRRNAILYNLIQFSELWDYSYNLTAYKLDRENFLFSNEYLDDDFYLVDAFQDFRYEEDQEATDFFPTNFQGDVLLINGDLDSETPTKFAVETFTALSVAAGKEKKLAIIPSEGHSASDNPCGINVVSDFFADPSTSQDACSLNETSLFDSTFIAKPDFPSSDSVSRFSGAIGNMWDGDYHQCERTDWESYSCEENTRVCSSCLTSCLMQYYGCNECFGKYKSCLESSGCPNKKLCDNRAEAANCSGACSPLSTAAIIGIVAGGVIGLVLSLLVYKQHAKRKSDDRASERSMVPPPDVEIDNKF